MDDATFREFLDHPGWRRVWAQLEGLQQDALRKAARESEDHARKLGRLDGVELVMLMLRTLQQTAGQESPRG